MRSLSIVTCTWNSAATVARTIESVQSQQGLTAEHVFVDGGSTDGTLELIARLAPAARVLHGVSGGISRAMNAGTAAATGDFVAHLHADDYYADDQVFRRLQAALAEHPQARWLVGRVAVLRDGVLHAPRGPLQPFTFSRYARGSATVEHPAVFIDRRLLVESGGFDETLRYAMDIDLWMRIGQQNRPAQVDSVLTIFREHAGSASTKNVVAARQEEWQVRRRYSRAAPWQTVLFALRFYRRLARVRRAAAAAGVSSAA